MFERIVLVYNVLNLGNDINMERNEEKRKALTKKINYHPNPFAMSSLKNPPSINRSYFTLSLLILLLTDVVRLLQVCHLLR